MNWLVILLVCNGFMACVAVLVLVQVKSSQQTHVHYIH